MMGILKEMFEYGSDENGKIIDYLLPTDDGQQDDDDMNDDDTTSQPCLDESTTPQKE